MFFDTFGVPQIFQLSSQKACFYRFFIKYLVFVPFLNVFFFHLLAEGLTSQIQFSPFVYQKDNKKRIKKCESTFTDLHTL